MSKSLTALTSHLDLGQAFTFQFVHDDTPITYVKCIVSSNSSFFQMIPHVKQCFCSYVNFLSLINITAFTCKLHGRKWQY